MAVAGLVGAVIGAALAGVSLRMQPGDPLLLGVLGLGASMAVAILLTPLYMGLAGDRRLLSAVEAGLAQVAMTIASWTAFYASVRGFE